jgi:glyoxylase-like metal-dependent hydrolase (beta-lactamase superfamily II)
MNRFSIPGTLRSVELGPLRVSYVPDGVVKMIPGFLFPETTDSDWSENAEYLDTDGWLTISSGGVLIERGERAILFDVGYGPHPEPTSNLAYGMGTMYGGAFLDNLRLLGRDPADIEAVVISHLHVEHVGWAAHPEFADIPVLLSEAEWANRKAEHGVTQEVLDAMAPRFQPVVDGQELLPGVSAVALPGHTAGQMGFEAAEAGDRLLGFADVFHSPVQIAHPDWVLVGDPNPQESTQMRRRVLDRLRDTSTIGFGMHFADVFFGRLTQRDDRATWEPLP